MKRENEITELLISNAIRLIASGGFEKKLIRAKESEHYTVKVPKEYLAFYSTSEDRWVLESGDFEIMVGASSEDIRLIDKIRI